MWCSLQRRLRFNGTPAHWKKWGWATAVAFVIFIALGLGSLYFPVIGTDLDIEGIISASTRAGYAPINNYLRYGFLFVCTLGVFVSVIASGIDKPIPAHQPDEAGVLSPASGLRTLTWAVLLVLCLAVALGRSGTNTTLPITDPFHEGEVLGFAPAVRGTQPLETTFLIHGPGKDLLPVLIADRLGKAGNRIATTRIAISLLKFITYLAAFACLLFIARLAITRESRGLLSSAFALLTFLVLDGILIKVNERDGMFLLHLATVFAFIDSVQRGKIVRAAVLGLASGALLPIGAMFVYDRALYSIGLGAVTTVLLCIMSQRAARLWAATFLPGLVGGYLLISELVHETGLAAIADQLIYWTKYGQDIWVIPLFDRPPLYKESETALFVASHSLLYIVPLGVASLVVCWCLVLLLGHARTVGKDKCCWGGNMLLCVLLIGVIFSLRVSLDRNVVLLPPAIGLLLVAVLLAALDKTSGLLRGPGTYGSWIAVIRTELGIALILVLGFAMREEVASAWRTLNSYANEWGDQATGDRALVPPAFLEANRRLVSESGDAKCIFSTDDNGLWYFFSDRPSCSRYHHLIYARSIAAQNEVMLDLERTKPPVIIFDGEAGIDGVNVFNEARHVMRYILRHYEPHLTTGETWLWRLRKHPLRFSDDHWGGQTLSLPRLLNRRSDAVIKGSLPRPVTGPGLTAVIVTFGLDNIPIYAARLSNNADGNVSWKALIPTAVLPQGNVLLRVWLSGNDGTLHKAASDIVLPVT